MSTKPKPKKFKRGGYTFGGTYFSEAQVDKIRAANQARRPTAADKLVPSARPLSSAARSRLDDAGRGSGTIDPTRTATSPKTVHKLRTQFGDPGVSGYKFLRAAVGGDLAAYVPGTRTAPGFKPSKGKAALNALTLLPPVRGVGAAAHTAAKLQSGRVSFGRVLNVSHTGADLAGRATLRDYGPEEGVVPTIHKLARSPRSEDYPIASWIAKRAFPNPYVPRGSKPKLPRPPRPPRLGGL